MSRRRVLVLAVALVVAVVGAAGAWAFTIGRPTVRSWRHPRVQAHISGPGQRVVMIGDSFTAGTGADRQRDGYAFRVARDRRWDATVTAEVSAGYLWSGVQGDTIAGLIARTKVQDPSLVIIAAGYNDARGLPPRQITQAVERTLQAAERRWPDAEYVTVGPVASGPTYGAAFGEVERIVARASSEAGWHHVDGLDWLPSRALIAGDGIHPNEQGHAQEARLLESALAGM